MDIVDYSVDKIAGLLPKNMRLPLNGFVNPNYHLLCVYPKAMELFHRFTTIDYAF